MRIRSLYMALPAVALGLAACSTTSSERTARAEPPDRGTATAGTTSTSEPRSDTSTPGTMHGTMSDVKGHPSDQVITGRIADATGDALVIEADTGERQTLSVVDETLVTIDGSDSNVSALTIGQDVRASFNEQDGRNVAVKVEAMGMPGSTGRTELPPGHPHHGAGGPTQTPPAEQSAPAPSTGSGGRY